MNQATSFQNSKLNAWLRTGAMFVAATALLADANAAVISFTNPTPVPNTFDGLYLNVLTGGKGTIESAVAGWDIDPYNYNHNLAFWWNYANADAYGGVAASAGDPYLDLAPGSVISAASAFSSSPNSTAAVLFHAPGSHVLGFRFFNEETGVVNYGYMTLSSSGSNGFPLTIQNWSIDNSGAAIVVRAIPEPSTAVLLALGVLAIGGVKLRCRDKNGRSTIG
ncbi:PEP-CTERM sorting domain-containing protein [Roseateles sp.]|uniref:PEP-CTERM sorting domain-containing protein n=1 Tax=Roseateles sp. TaxID=1971397 RepID=UPI0032676068